MKTSKIISLIQHRLNLLLFGIPVLKISVYDNGAEGMIKNLRFNVPKGLKIEFSNPNEDKILLIEDNYFKHNQ